jgi:transcriptional regulator with GAF, ATPase, and Fis domain
VGERETSSPVFSSMIQLSIGDRKRIRQQVAALGIVGTAESWRSALDLAFVAAGHDAPVLIQGETGTGKEKIAEFIRAVAKLKPWKTVNCAVLRAGTASSELFGHEKGAFTGAAQKKTGLFVAADRGGLFLDEVGELSTEVQAGLLRVLQERTVRPMGSTHEFVVRVKVVAATNRILLEQVGEGRFREDLYYRLSSFVVKLPPLRERLEDVTALAQHFLGLAVPLSSALGSFLRAQPWRGNVRELQSVLKSAAAIARREAVEVPHVQAVLQQRGVSIVAAPGLALDALEVLRLDRGWMSSGEIAARLGETSRRVKDALVRPIKEGRIETSGATRGRRYRAI